MCICVKAGGLIPSTEKKKKKKEERREGRGKLCQEAHGGLKMLPWSQQLPRGHTGPSRATEGLPLGFSWDPAGQVAKESEVLVRKAFGVGTEGCRGEAKTGSGPGSGWPKFRGREATKRSQRLRAIG